MRHNYSILIYSNYFKKKSNIDNIAIIQDMELNVNQLFLSILEITKMSNKSAGL